ncbi:acyltransferase family protein [Sphingomonas abaci]|uniref:Fucose 4-O-acetylase-like acetyltransferase n=1 Tax=Sphingomonas abaci TaxID=237611 RepID=A0A7W7AMS3_9SPHN|nr:acyltransferase [Sphingomonas abaci]MBB4619914.1 fucose 4-O-acetylase-like acetyltransferase [Sphingomonas abaci]
MKQRLEVLDATRGIAVAAMVFGHVLLWGGYTYVHPVFGMVQKGLTSFRMPALMLVSGFLAHSLLSRPFHKTIDRLAHFSWIYLVWLVPLLVLTPFGNEFSFSNYAQNLPRPVTVLWFLWVLTLFTLSIPIVRLLPRQVILFGSVALGVANYAGFLNIETYSYENAAIYALMFYAGLLYRPEIEQVLRAEISRSLMVKLISAAIMTAATAKLLRSWSGHDLLGGPQRLLICLSVLYLIRIAVDLVPGARRLSLLGRHTLPIYVIHLPLLMIIRKPIATVNGSLAPLMTTILLMAASLLFYFVAKRAHLEWLFERPNWLTALCNRLSERNDALSPLKVAPVQVGFSRDRFHRHDPALDLHDKRRQALWQIRTGRRRSVVTEPHPSAVLAKFSANRRALADQAPHLIIDPHIGFDRTGAVPISPDQSAYDAQQGERDDTPDRRKIG